MNFTNLSKKISTIVLTTMLLMSNSELSYAVSETVKEDPLVDKEILDNNYFKYYEEYCKSQEIDDWEELIDRIASDLKKDNIINGIDNDYIMKALFKSKTEYEIIENKRKEKEAKEKIEKEKAEKEKAAREKAAREKAEKERAAREKAEREKKRKNTNAVNPYVAYGYDQMVKDANKLAEIYPDIVNLDSIGKSVEGRDLTLIKLGKGQAKILLCGTHHAREYISSTFLMEMVDQYAHYYVNNKNFGNYNVKSLLDQVTIYIVPMVNPDGINLVQNGIGTVKDPEKVKSMRMVQPDYSRWKANLNGVDLNRQYPTKWAENISNAYGPSSEMYKGTAPATEPEIQAMMKVSREHNFILSASYHTKGEVIYWADIGTYEQIPGVSEMTDRLSSLTGYQKLPVSMDEQTYGAGYENWFREKFKRPSFCIELTPYNNDYPHPDKDFDSLLWNTAKYTGLFFADEALKRK